MIELPNFEKAFEYENNFYLSCDITRISKILSHYKIYKMIKEIPGEIVECGVFKDQLSMGIPISPNPQQHLLKSNVHVYFYLLINE